MDITVYRGLIGEEDLSAGFGTFTRRKSDGTTGTYTKINSTTIVPVYANGTARDAAITSPEAGIIVYNTALAKLQIYTTVWETITSVAE